MLSTKNLKESIELIKSLGKKVGLSLNPETSIETIEKYLQDINLVLVMTVHPGFGGQKFLSKVLDKIKNFGFRCKICQFVGYGFDCVWNIFFKKRLA